MLFSVIIPYYYKYDSYFIECVDSIINQSFSNFECLILISDYEKNYFRHSFQDKRIVIKYINELDQSSKRNAGLNQAKGDYIVFLDCDDYLENSFLEYAHGIIDAIKDVNLIAFGQTRNEDELFFVENGGSVFFGEKTCKEILYSNYMIKKNNVGIIFDSSCSKVFKKDIIEKYNIRFVDGLKCAEDAVFVRTYSKYTDSLFINPTYKAYYWRKNPISTMNNLDSGFLNLERFTIEIRKVLLSINPEYSNNFTYYISQLFSIRVGSIVSSYYSKKVSYKEMVRIIKKYFFNAQELKKTIKTFYITSIPVRLILLSIKTKTTIWLCFIRINKMRKNIIKVFERN